MSFDPAEWITSNGGTLHSNDLVTAWCHPDTKPSAKLYRDGKIRVHCFACHCTHFPAHLQKTVDKVTIQQYNEYRSKHNVKWPTLQEVLDANVCIQKE